MSRTLSDMSLEELQRERVFLRGFVAVAAILALLVAAVLIHWWLGGTWDRTRALGVLPLMMLVAMMIPQLTRLGDVRAEIARRQRAL
jgi:hypothetical protein